jgi:hypothetical protein
MHPIPPSLLLRFGPHLRVLVVATTLVLSGFVSAAAPVFVPTDAEFQKDASWLRTHTAGLVAANRATHQDGRTVFYTDALKHYGLLFTRDFAYFVEFAGDLLSPKETSGYLEFLLAGQRNDGCIPDRVNRDGKAIYSPGGERAPMADHALDNAAFLASAVCRYVERTGDLAFLRKHERALRWSLDHVNRAANGLVYNPPDNPQCVYGYTDIVRQTGHLLMCSALYYEACGQLALLCRQAGVGEPDEYARRADLIKTNIGRLWDRDSGAFYAADGLCRQYDVWGTAFVIDRNLATKEQEQRALTFLVNNYDRYAQKGHIRHLLTFSTWQSTFQYRDEGVYQNGGYWASPLAWFLPALARRDPALAQRALRECLAEFRTRGIHEWINGGVMVLPDFFNSAISVYSLLRGNSAP